MVASHSPFQYVFLVKVSLELLSYSIDKKTSSVCVQRGVWRGMSRRGSTRYRDNTDHLDMIQSEREVKERFEIPYHTWYTEVLCLFPYHGRKRGAL